MNCVTAQKSAAHDLDLKSAWFIPSMAVNADPICETLLSDVRDHFRSSDGWDANADGNGEYFTELKKIPGPYHNGAGLEPTVQLSESDQRSLVMIPREGARLYAFFQTNSGCGGACETAQLLVSEEPCPERHFNPSSGNSQVASTPAFESGSTGAPHDHGARLQGRPVTFLGRARKVTSCRAAPGLLSELPSYVSV